MEFKYEESAIFLLGGIVIWIIGLILGGREQWGISIGVLTTIISGYVFFFSNCVANPDYIYILLFTTCIVHGLFCSIIASIFVLIFYPEIAIIKLFEMTAGLVFLEFIANTFCYLFANDDMEIGV